MKRKIYEQRLIAIALVVLGFVSLAISNWADATAMIFCLFIGVPLLISRKIWIL